MKIKLGPLLYGGNLYICEKGEKKSTYGNAGVRADKVDVGLRDGAHTNLVKGSCQERCERAHEHDGAVTGRRTDRHADEVLLGDVALDETVGEGVLVERYGDRGLLTVGRDIR